MIPQNELILLDTNVLIHLVRGNEIGQRIDTNYQLRARLERPLISIITVGESFALARKFKWGKTKVDQLKELLRELVVVDIHASVLEKYAEISDYLENIGQPMGQNDMWIAATASASNSWLLTTDTDFDRLHPTLIRREYVAPHPSTKK